MHYFKVLEHLDLDPAELEDCLNYFDNDGNGRMSFGYYYFLLSNTFKN